MDIADTMKEFMELLGHEVDVAYSGKRAIARAKEWVPDAVLLDIGLKDMTGHDLVRALRAEPATRDIYLLACSGFSSEDDKRKLLTPGSMTTWSSRSTSTPWRNSNCAAPPPTASASVAGL
jgi:CheY-like chemotaxis protein